MSGIFDKIRNIGLANVHTLLDKLGSLNSVGQVEQYVRDLEEGRKDLEGALAEARYDLKTKTNNLETDTAHATQLENQIKALAGAGGDQNMTSAKLLAVELGTLRNKIAAEAPAVPEQKAVVDQLVGAVAGVNQQESQAKAKLGQLRSQVSASAAKEKATKALEQVGTAMNNGGAIDSAMDKIGRQNARTDAAFDRAMGGIPVNNASAEADAILAELLAPKPTQPAAA